ncbi:MAG: gliding motility-associated C-terminal domain-containing protein [Chitinophagaceae bacterium]|nr:gliding motility-associated C-terminal domain-containing protein [Chitinophagaceae bacterium]
MKRLFVTLIILLSLHASYAAHIIGGEMRYEYVGPGVAPNSKIYRIIMVLFRGDATGPNVADLAPSYIIAIYNNDNNQKVRGTAGSTGDNWTISKISSLPNPSVPIILPTCIQGAPALNYTYAIYAMTIELPDNLNGYTAAFQTCCRLAGLMNVANSTGSTYSCRIPGTNQLGTGTDNCPSFKLPINVICKDAPFTLDFGAIEVDPNDSLVYSLCEAFNGGASTNASFDDPAPPPYASANYNLPYSGTNPFGTSVSINPQTGVISGMAPDFGRYVVCVCINVYRQGVLIATHKKDLIVQVSDCTLTAANAMPDFVTCDGFNVQFSHTSNGANSVFWDLGDLSTQGDTSSSNTPTYTYSDTGRYTIKLVINRGTGCADSTYRTIGVYPGFFPDFTNTGICISNPVQFNDATTATYGVVNGWRWNFGDLTTLADTSRSQNPSWLYAGIGPKDITLIASSSKGCRDTITKSITIIDKPPITLAFKDTLICVPDAVQLQASGTGVFSWTPLTNIVNANTGTPTVNPTSTTWYHVQLNEQGCINTDSVQVRVVSFVTLNAMPDTIICLTDSVRLNVVSDGLQYLWSPAASLNDPTLKNPMALPTGTSTQYTVIARIGSCTAQDNVTITAIPYPVANAGNDTLICYNQPAYLNGSHNGVSFAWSPTGSLINANTLNPTAFPADTTAYVLSVLSDQGCPKAGTDTVIVAVLPKIVPFAGNDTLVIVNQPLQFNATGGTSYQWIPSTWLNDPSIGDPIGIYGANADSIRYTVLVFNQAGCYDSAFVKVTVFKTNPYVFVPSAFTPNGDGLNDLIRPIAVGVKRINYFSIYNRWGQLLFKTTTNGHGWNGRIKGVPQATNVFVWMVSAVDYLDKPIFLKGTVTLIR